MNEGEGSNLHMFLGLLDPLRVEGMVELLRETVSHKSLGQREEGGINRDLELQALLFGGFFGGFFLVFWVGVREGEIVKLQWLLVMGLLRVVTWDGVHSFLVGGLELV